MVPASKRRANERYTARNYEQIAFRVRRGVRDSWKVAASVRGLSLAALIVSAVEEYLTAHPVEDASSMASAEVPE